MKVIKYLPNIRSVIVEDIVHECVAIENKIELFEHFLKTYIIDIEDLPEGVQ